jgi:hypothetical protein
MTRLDLTRCWIVLALSLGAWSGALAATADLAPSPAVQALRQAPYFAVGTIGVAGTLSNEEKALQAVLRQADAPRVLLALLEDPHTSRGGRLYALLGVRHLELAAGKRASGASAEARQALREKVRQLFSQYRADPGQVDVIRGCSLSAQPVAEVTLAIDQGRVRLSPTPRMDQQPQAERT